MLMGQVHHQLDEKCRIRIPAKFKDELGSNPLITCGSNGCLFVFPQKDVEAIFSGKFNKGELSDSAATRSQRLLMANAVCADEDKQGRVLLPQHLLDHAKIKKDIITIGVQTRVEIWSKEAWEDYCNGVNFDDSLKQIEAMKEQKGE